jgi:hypothetical protein
MADQFQKDTFFNKFKEKASAKGFELFPNRSDMANGVPLMVDLLEAMSEALDDIFYNDQNLPGSIKASSLKLGPDGLQQPAAYKEATVKSDATTDPQFWAWMETFHGLLQAVYPEPGFGAPDTFALALKALLAQKPSSITAKITQGSGTVKVTT